MSKECCGYCDYYVEENGKGKCSAPVPSYVVHSNLNNEVTFDTKWKLECMFFIDSEWYEKEPDDLVDLEDEEP